MIFVSYDLHLICALVHYAKSVIFLSTVFFLLSGCPFRCFDRMPALSVCCGYHIPSERDAKNSVKVSISSGNRHIFSSMLKMCLAGTSLCQRCRMPDEIPSATNRLYQASLLNGLSGYLINNTIYSRKSNASHNNFPIIRTVLRIQQFSPDRHE